MHDCRKTQLQMTDWLFADAPVNYLAQIGACQVCYEQYHALRSALHSFDEASDLMMPQESYWAGYEADLRVKLAQEAAPRRWSWFHRRLGWMVPVAVGLAILLFVVLGNSRTPQSANPAHQMANAIAPGPRTGEPSQDTLKDSPKKPRPEKQTKPERKAPTRAPEKKPYLLNDPNQMMALNVADLFQNPTTTQHFERAQMLLREFRNAPTTQQATFDLAAEKQRARKLLYKTIVLRREAEARGDVPTEEVLSDLEPLLLDIANLPQRPTSEDVSPIRERIQKKEIVAKLQFYATPVTVAALEQ